MKKILVLLIVFGFSTGSLYAQNKTIKGRVIDDFLDPIPFAKIMINDTIEVGKTDLNGYYQINIPVTLKRITFMYLGLERTAIEFMDNCNEVEVIMMSSVIYDFITLRKIDRLRMKRFKQLPEKHKEAFDKGIFKTDTACFTQEFITAFKKKQKKTASGT